VVERESNHSPAQRARRPPTPVRSDEGGFKSVTRATETPFNLVLDARP
jgi:hypothetical protein